jgi:diguanylate cyclase (GGDEF)-like protein
LLLFQTGDPHGAHARLLADHVASAAVSLRQTDSAREPATVDISRAIFDERKIEGDLQRELSRTQRYHHSAAIVIVQATNVRLLRERFGSFLAERLVQRLGGALAQHTRDVDGIGSYHDSGYTMILTQASAEAAELAAKRLLARARSAALEGDGVPGLELHLLSGWASAPEDGTTTDALFAAAERRMYTEASEVA